MSRERCVALVPMVDRMAVGLVRRLPPWVLVEDLMSAGREALARILAARPELAGDELEALVWVCARGAMLDELRKTQRLGFGRRRKTPLDFVPLDEALAVPSEGRELGWTREQMARALGLLEARDREVLARHYLAEEDLDEVGARLGVSKARASQLHLRALERLRAVVGMEAA